MVLGNVGRWQTVFEPIELEVKKQSKARKQQKQKQEHTKRKAKNKEGNRRGQEKTQTRESKAARENKQNNTTENKPRQVAAIASKIEPIKQTNKEQTPEKISHPKQSTTKRSKKRTEAPKNDQN